jgi:hypothetical protein
MTLPIPWSLLLTLFAAPSCAQRLDVPLPERAATAGAQEAPFDQTHARWTAVLAAHLREGRLDYERLGRERGELDQYLLDLRGVTREEFARWTREQRYAFWINAYNAFTVHLVLSRYPVASIQDIGTTLAPVWKKEFIPLGHLHGEGTTELVSLDTIEHRILRPQFEDARVHAAVNCASESCPPLAAEAFRADALEAQLDARVLAWLSDPALNRYDEGKRRAEVSAIFEWFQGDFVRDAGSVEAWIARHGPESARWMAEGEVELRTLDYSWKLNDAPRAR